MKKKIICSMIAAAMVSALFAGCSVPETVDDLSSAMNEIVSSVDAAVESGDTAVQSTKAETTLISELANSTDDLFSKRDLSGDYDKTGAVTVTCSDKSFTVNGEGAKADGNVLTITEEGVYIIEGTINDGRIVVEADDSAKVQLVLNNCSVISSDFAPIYVKSADKVFLTLPDGTKNTLSDGKTYKASSDDSSVDSVVFSKADLVINGSGELNVNGNMSHAIVSKDDLKITGGVINITSVGSAVCGKDNVCITNTVMKITSGGDGVKSTNDEDQTKGYIYIESGTIDITSENDAFQAETDILIKDAVITAVTGGGHENSEKSHEENFGGLGAWGGNKSTSSEEDSSSARGIKTGGTVYINGGTITLDCADDTLNSGKDVNISEGTLSFLSGDDGIHSDGNTVISGGVLDIKNSYEGIEGYSITVSGGVTSVTASDDGMNATNGESEGMMPGMGGMSGVFTDSDVFILITGGDLHVNAGGDGIDSNGTLKVTGGSVIVDGPTNSGNGALDAGSGSMITGGTVIAVGSSGMAETFGSSSTQASILYNMSESHSAGETITLKDESGKVLAEYKAVKTFNSVVISTPEIKSNGTYTLTVGSNEYKIEMTSVSYSNGGGMGGGMPGGDMGGMQGGRGGMSGERPEMPDMQNGERPEMPNMQNGERPEMPDKQSGSSSVSSSV